MEVAHLKLLVVDQLETSQLQDVVVSSLPSFTMHAVKLITLKLNKVKLSLYCLVKLC